MYLYRFLHAGESGAATFAAGILDLLARSVAVRADVVCYLPAEQGAAHVLYLAGAVTGGAGLDVGRVLGALAVAVGAGTVTLERDLLVAALANFFKGELDACAYVAATLCAGTSASAAAAAESESIAEVEASERTAAECSSAISIAAFFPLIS